MKSEGKQEKKKDRNLIKFDWALKRLLRNKANFDVLEGFLSVIIGKSIVIDHIGESESRYLRRIANPNGRKVTTTSGYGIS
jgi:hypothetical protein